MFDFIFCQFLLLPLLILSPTDAMNFFFYANNQAFSVSYLINLFDKSIDLHNNKSYLKLFVSAAMHKAVCNTQGEN